MHAISAKPVLFKDLDIIVMNVEILIYVNNVVIELVIFMILRRYK